MLKLNFILSFLLFAYASLAASSCKYYFHSFCHLNWTFQNAKCGDVLNVLESQFKSCCLQKTILPQYTNYTLLNVNRDTNQISGQIHFTDGYTDQQDITLTQSGANCIADTCSHSLSLSYYDYDANYCDGHNLIRGTNFTVSEKVVECRFIPKPDNRNKYCDTQ